MKVYLDLIWLLNFYLDFLLLLTTSIVLKRNVSLKKIFLGTLGGSLSLIFLFWNVGNFFLFIFKVILALFMVIITFGIRDSKYVFNNLSYFYMLSIILGGFLYYLNLEFKSIVSSLFLLLISPFILYIYYRQAKQFKSLHSFTYKVTIGLKNGRKLVLNGFLDTGNRLVDPITNKPIILLEKGIIDEAKEKIYSIPFNSLNNHNLLKCFKPAYVEINQKKYKNYLLGISDKKFHLDGVECLLNYKMMEGDS